MHEVGTGLGWKWLYQLECPSLLFVVFILRNKTWQEEEVGMETLAWKPPMFCMNSIWPHLVLFYFNFLLGAIFWVLTLLELYFYLLLWYHAFLVPNIGAWAIRRILQSKERVDWSLFGKKNCLTQLWCTDDWFGVLGLELVVGWGLQGHFLACVVCWLLGAAFLFPWNSILTVGDYYYAVFPVSSLCVCKTQAQIRPQAQFFWFLFFLWGLQNYLLVMW
jgi:hypothetical protein